MSEMTCVVVSQETFRDMTLYPRMKELGYVNPLWHIGEEREIPESLYNRCVQSAGPTAFELKGKKVPPSNMAKSQKKGTQTSADEVGAESE